MNHIYRNRLDIRVAFESGLKRDAQQISDEDTSTAVLKINQDTAESNHEPCKKNETPTPSTTRVMVRKIAQFGYRLLKPILRPIAFRVRHYLISDLHQEIQKTSAAMAAQVQQKIQNEAATATRETQNEPYLPSPATTLKIQQEILRASNATTLEIRRELQKVSATLLKNQQMLNDILIPRLDRIEQYAAASARRVAVNCDVGEMLVRTEVGFVLCSASDHALISGLLESGELEPGTRLLIQKFLRPGDLYVDVGANIGMHTLAAARAMQGQGKIIAFEPFEQTKRMLEKSVWMNGFSNMTTIYQAAVSNTTGHHEFFIGATSGHHSLFSLDHTPNHHQNPIEVPLLRLDDTIAPGQPVNLMKIDVEGAELDVIEGGASIITSNPDIALIVEFGASHLRRTGRNPDQWFESFSKLGLNHRVINQDTGMLESLSIAELTKVESVNLFFARENSAAWKRLS